MLDSSTRPFCRISVSISFTLEGSSIVEGTVTVSLAAICRSSFLKIYPDRVLGNRFTTIARLKQATGPIVSRTR